MENYILLIIRCWTRFSVLRWFSLLATIIQMKGLVDSPIRYGGNIIIMIIMNNTVRELFLNFFFFHSGA